MNLVLKRSKTWSGPPPAIFAVFVVLGAAVTLAMLGYVLTGLKYSAAAYITALTVDFFTVIFGFVIALDVIMQQPMDVPGRPTPD
jgi:TRAP-type mannitol/chloroaromatic compound transport system permease small subunit